MTTSAAVVSRVRQWSQSPRSLGRIGFVSTIAIAAASFWVGAIPVYFRLHRTPVVSLLPVGAFQARALFYGGLGALLFAWLHLGRLTCDGAAGTDWRDLRRTSLRWAAPILVAIPLSSRDLWAYAAQGQLVLHHLDPYSLGPSALPGQFSVEVSHRWVDTPAPYGPLWLLLGKILAAIVGHHVGLSVAALRLIAAAGFGLLALALPKLAIRAGGRPDIAIWLVLANPLTLILGLGGGHNDLLMVGLMATGLVVVTAPGAGTRGLLLGTVVLAAAVAIKSPAVIALAFAVPLWLRHSASDEAPAPRMRATVATVIVLGTFTSVFALITAASGLGLGWIKQANSSASVVSWMSLPSFASILWHLVSGHTHRMLKLDSQMTHFRTVGTVISIAFLLALWIVAVRAASSSEPIRSTPAWLSQRTTWQLLATALASVVVLGPSVQPWYFLWALVIWACTALNPRRLPILAGLSFGMVAMIRPNGVGLQMNPAVVPILGLPVLLAFAVIQPSSIRTVTAALTKSTRWAKV